VTDTSKREKNYCTPQLWPMRTGTEALICFHTFLISPHLSRIYPGMLRGQSQSKLNWNYGFCKSRRSATRPPSCRPLCRTPPPPPPPHHPPPVTTAGAARHADCGNPSSFGLHRVSPRGTWPCRRGLVLFSGGAGVRWWGGTGRPGAGGHVGAQYLACGAIGHFVLVVSV